MAFRQQLVGRRHTVDGGKLCFQQRQPVVQVPVAVGGHGQRHSLAGTVAKLAMRQPFVLFKGLTFQKLCLPGAFARGSP